MDDFDDYITTIAWPTSGHVPMDLDLPVHDAYCNTIIRPTTPNHINQPIGFHGAEDTPVQKLQPRKISPAQWDEVKDVIREQYIVENCTLNELVSYMEKERSFVAR
jgi:hypothetical protein